MAASSSATSPRAMSPTSTTATMRRPIPPARRRIFDGIAPVVTDDEGNLLPIRAFHSVGNRDGFNFLNPVAGQNARAFADGTKGVDVVAFEDGLASLPGADDDEGGYDGDFNDAFVAVSDDRLSRNEVSALVAKTGISRLVGTDGADEQTGTGKDDQLIALDGNDVIRGRGGDDRHRSQRRQRPRLWRSRRRPHLRRGRARPPVRRRRPRRDRGRRGRRQDSAAARAGTTSRATRATTGCTAAAASTRSRAARAATGSTQAAAARSFRAARTTTRLFGYAGAADVFKFDLIPFGRRPDRRASRTAAIASRSPSYLEVEGFGDIEVSQRRIRDACSASPRAPSISPDSTRS